MVGFGQLVIGPPGSGKTTYCYGMQEYLEKIGRKVHVVNLDPANDALPYTCHIDISHLITVSDVMDSLNLGPNGALMYCLEYLEKNFDWLQQQLEGDVMKEEEKGSESRDTSDCVYILFDCPGQVELYTHHTSMRNIVQKLTHLDYRLCAIHLVDSHYCADVNKFISVLLTSLSAMLQIELPHLNILSKVDLIEKFGSLPFNIDFFTEVLDLDFLIRHMQDDKFMQKYKKLNQAICGVVEDYSLVSFLTLNIQDKDSVCNIVKHVDKAHGYYKGRLEEKKMLEMMSSTLGSEFEYLKTKDVRETYMSEDAQPNLGLSSDKEDNMDSS